MLRRILGRALAVAALLAAPALSAQERPDTILVLDGSGSMWGQIDGVAKITIAQEVVTELLGIIPEEQQLGLALYGHRRRGDCTDIETVVAPGPDTRGAIAEAVAGISPRGKTPMTDAVIAAAEALRHTEEAATVILVSDGVETCNPDPCAAARVLEETGVDFTAHVVGFDVANEPEALAQMQCLAEETGGIFRTAADAPELAAALEAVAEPVAETVAFRATEGEGGPEIAEPLIWEVFAEDGPAAEPMRGATAALDLAPGPYRVEVLRPSDEAFAEAEFTVEGAMTVTVALPVPRPEASVSGPETAVAGSTVEVGWDGPGGEGDYITVSALEDTGYVNYSYVREGDPLTLLMPPREGTYEIRYVRSEGREVLAAQPIAVTPAEATLGAPGSGPAGATVDVTWTGPAHDGDYLAVSAPEDGGYVNYTYTREGDPLGLTLPPEPGEYEIRYVMRQDRTVIARRPITVTPLGVALDAPETATAGEAVEIGWDGPAYDGDYVTVSVPDDSGYVNYTYTREGDPLTLTMPPEPGEYEVRYVMRQDRTVLASVPIEVTELSAALEAPATAEAGATVEIGWEGPAYDGDYITVSVPDEDGYVNYTYTREGSPLGLRMPLDPGSYEVRYVMRQDRTVLAAQPLEVVEVRAGIEAVSEAPAGSLVVVDWEGPGYEGDYIDVAAPGAGDGDYVNYTYAREGSPMLIRLPITPGDYELRYIATGDGRSVLARHAVTATQVNAEIDAPEAAPAGANIAIRWEGPDYEGDYIALFKAGEEDDRSYRYTAKDSPMVMTMPEGPGRYELRYITGQGRQVLATHGIELTYEPE